jgi:bifunctional DNase/RNase
MSSWTLRCRTPCSVSGWARRSAHSVVAAVFLSSPEGRRAASGEPALLDPPEARAHNSPMADDPQAGGVAPSDQNEELILVELKGLMLDPGSNAPIILLKEKAGSELLPIWIGVFEANAIALQIENVQTPRPMTHDLLKNVIQDLSAHVDRIVVTELKENTFYAVIHLRTDGSAVVVDARPSDAIALALRSGAPIFVEDSVIASARSVESSKESMVVGRLQKWLENLSDEELGKYKM